MFGTTPITAIPASESVLATQSPMLKITKTATPAIYEHVSQVISYSFKVENTGNVTISNPFTVFDDKATNETCPSPPTILDPGQFITCTASYTILRSDMTSGSVTNVAYATGKFGDTTITSNTDSETIRAKQTLTYTFLPIVYNSPYGVYVLPISFHYVSHNTMFIIGEVLNNTSDSLTWVKVTVNFYKAGGNLASTGDTYMRPIDLPAWGKGCFSISMDVPLNWSYYQFTAPIYNKSGTSSSLTIFNDSGLYNSVNRDYDIVGQVRNDGNQRSSKGGVSGTLYNASGVPLGCNHVSSTDLDPGQISSFAINFLSYYRDYKDVSYYRLRVADDMP
jgi:hypothetical protein